MHGRGRGEGSANETHGIQCKYSPMVLHKADSGFIHTVQVGCTELFIPTYVQYTAAGAITENSVKIYRFLKLLSPA
jgi:hypothetical protein